MTSSNSEDSDGPRGEQQAGPENNGGAAEEQTDTYDDDDDDDFDARSNHDDEGSDGNTAGAGDSTGHHDSTRLTLRPASPAGPNHQLSSADGVIGTERPQTAAPRQASGRRQVSAQLSGQAPHSPAFIVAYGTPPSSPPTSHPPHSGLSATPRYANGLPLRKPTGPLPGMPILSDLVRRYPVRQAPATGPEVSLISGQLFVNDRLRGLVSRRRHPEPPGPRQHNYVLAESLTGQPLVPMYSRGAGGADTQGMGSTYLEARRKEKEQRAALSARPAPKTADTHGEFGGGVHCSPPWGSYSGGGDDVTGPSLAGAFGSRHLLTADANGAVAAAGAAGGGVGAGAGAGRQEHVRRESVERWLESSDKASEGTDGGAGQASSQAAASDDPSLVYRQYSIFRTYAGYGGAMGAGASGARGVVMGRRQHGQPLRPSASLPVLSRGARRPGYDQKRGSGDAGSGSPSRPPSQSVKWSPQRARAW